MKKTQYERFDGLKTTQLPDGGRIDEYQTSQVSFVWPRKIEKMYRYLRLYRPACKYVLDWNPLVTPSFGIWLDYNDDLTAVTLRSRGAHFLKDGDVDMTFAIKTRWQLRMALSQINHFCEYYDQCVTNSEPQKR